MATTIIRSERAADIIRVLAVEDNPGDLGLVKELLEDAKIGHYRLHSAVRLSSAIEMLRKETFDAVLLDLNLPDSNGFDTFSTLHGRFPRAPIVVLTGGKDEELAIRAINEGAQDYLFKDELTARNLSHAIFFAIQRKRIELELMEEKGRAELYIDLLTHDIINYNTAVMGYLQLAEMRLNLEERDKRLIVRPLEELRNSTELIANIRDIQRLNVERGKTELIDICQMLKEIKEEFEHPLGREVEITLNDGENCSVMASSLLRDAFSNIVSNAIKHSSGPLLVGITLSPEPRDMGDHIRISIEDNGPGIPDVMKEKAFDRSMRGLTKAVGHGLGLYIVKRLVEDLGGNVWVEDRIPGDYTQGARLVVLLPAT